MIKGNILEHVEWDEGKARSESDTELGLSLPLLSIERRKNRHWVMRSSSFHVKIELHRQASLAVDFRKHSGRNLHYFLGDAKGFECKVSTFSIAAIEKREIVESVCSVSIFLDSFQAERKRKIVPQEWERNAPRDFRKIFLPQKKTFPSKHSWAQL